MKNIYDYEEILTELLSGKNLLISGSAGSGKTYTIMKYADKIPYAVKTATTGTAALNIGGETIHRFLNLGKSSRPEMANIIISKWNKIKNSKTPWDTQRWKTIQNMRTLIIDEASMLRRDTFELIDAVLSSIKEDNRPFGGIQMVLIADFLQLPPVITDQDLQQYPDLKDPYCFQSDTWKFADFKSYNLTSNYRQGEGKFLEALEKIRKGEMNDEIEEMISGRLNAQLNTNIEPVKLFPHKYKVEQENLLKLDELPDEKFTSKAILTGKTYDIEILKKDCPAEEYLHYCKGAQIMMITNHPQGLWVNGSIGIVESIDPLRIKLSGGETIEVSKFTWERSVHKVENNKVSTKIVATMIQYPFKLCWSATLHKSQGQTMDFVEIDLSNCFSYGQAYVGLSRVKSLEGLKLIGWNRNSIKADERVLEFYNFK